jgi:hypothetical protein
VLASAFNGWKHLQHWRTVTKVARAQVTPSPAEGISPAQPDGLDAEHSQLLHVGSKSLISASRLPALMCSSLACGSVIIALVVSTIVTALYTWSTHGLVRRLLAPIVNVIGGFLAFLIACILSRMVLARCLFDPKQLKGGGGILNCRNPLPGSVRGPAASADEGRVHGHTPVPKSTSGWHWRELDTTLLHIRLRDGDVSGVRVPQTRDIREWRYCSRRPTRIT